jgi:hypothetical protein
MLALMTATSAVCETLPPALAIVVLRERVQGLAKMLDLSVEELREFIAADFELADWAWRIEDDEEPEHEHAPDCPHASPEPVAYDHEGDDDDSEAD